MTKKNFETGHNKNWLVAMYMPHALVPGEWWYVYGFDRKIDAEVYAKKYGFAVINIKGARAYFTISEHGFSEPLNVNNWVVDGNYPSPLMQVKKNKKLSRIIKNASKNPQSNISIRYCRKEIIRGCPVWGAY